MTKSSKNNSAQSKIKLSLKIKTNLFELPKLDNINHQNWNYSNWSLNVNNGLLLVNEYVDEHHKIDDLMLIINSLIMLDESLIGTCSIIFNNNKKNQNFNYFIDNRSIADLTCENVFYLLMQKELLKHK